jgi:large subunit ribosomal protein L6
MSRIGKIPVAVSKDVKVVISNNAVNMEGAKGKLNLTIPDGIKVDQKDAQLWVTRTNDIKLTRALHGTIRAHLVNMVEGVTKGHKKELEIQGVGFRATLAGNKLTLNVGLSHPVDYEVPVEVKVTMNQQTGITIEGTDKAIVGEVAAEIRRIKPPEPYKGKGIRYSGEYVRRKQGKSVTK